MPNTDWLNDPQLKNMSNRKKEFILQLMKESEGKSAAETVPLLLNTQKQMQMQGIQFTEQEQNAMFQILTAKLNPVEKARFDAMKKMLHF